MSELHTVVHIMRRFNTDRWGGTEEIVVNTAKRLTQYGTTNYIFCLKMLSNKAREVVNTILIRRFSYCFPWFGLSQDDKHQLELKGGNPLSFSLLLSLLFQPNLSLIHTHTTGRLGAVARIVAKLRKVPYVVSIHGGVHSITSDERQRMMNPIASKWEWGKAFGALLGSRKLLQDANAIICVGTQEYELTKTQYPDNKVVYLPNGIDTTQFGNASTTLFKTQFQIPTDQKIILCVSRIDTQKNQLLLVKAFHQFHQHHPDYQLVLIGSITAEPYFKTIQDYIDTHQLTQSITIIKGLEPHDPLLKSAFVSADMFVFPTQHEPFGIVVLEAWAAGIPVIAANVGGIPGFTTDQKNVLLFESNQQDDLLSKMESLHENKALQESLIIQGKHEVTHYSISTISQTLHQLYHEVIHDA